MESMQDLFWKLYNAETELQVHEIVNANPILDDPKNWRLYGSKQYGENFGNFGTFEGQQYHPIPALVEKITNSVDALLMKECIAKDIPLKSEKAPKSMGEAVEKFFGIKDGDFSEVGAGKRRDIGGNIQIIASGDLKTPSITVYDDGEGQHPDNFEDTFLSLHRKNKSDIKFAQGKYNMGSTGAVTFCGENKYQLIASKRTNSDKCFKNNHNPFGFTLVRRHPMSKVEE
ncbi:ATP-binding protein [Bacteroidota bacterium]